jgi:all-trans-retinol 13,14-reductase
MQQNTNSRYDVIVVGAGLGGLVCAAILSKEGYKVCVVEKNQQIGGCLQSFKRDGVKFDACVHYIGGLGMGQNLYQFFNYLGIMQFLETHELARDGFDMVMFDGDEEMYPYGAGYDNFIKTLAQKFTGEEENIRKYCNEIQRICSLFDWYNISEHDNPIPTDVLLIGTRPYIEGITADKKLQAVLGGTNLLYSGVADKTPLYLHALIINSYILGAWKCKRGTDYIAKLLAKEIKRNNGEILLRSEVTAMDIEEGEVKAIKLKNGYVTASKYISAIHPAQTLSLIAPGSIRPAYRHRISSLQNSASGFVVYAVLKPDSYKYSNRNYYVHKTADVWNNQQYAPDEWPKSYAVFETSDDYNYCTSVTIMTYMDIKEVEQWAGTKHTTLDDTSRGSGYEAFKKQKAEKLLQYVFEKFPAMKNAIAAYYVSTPLTLRDYMGTDDGSMYGIIKDYNDPVKTLVSPKTKISNLLLTGQNIDIHGVLGVTVSAFLTCSMILGRDYLVRKIREVNEAHS